MSNTDSNDSNRNVTLRSALAAFNAIRPGLKPEALMYTAEARAACAGKADAKSDEDFVSYGEHALFASVELLAPWLESLTLEERERLINTEMLMGWFMGEGDDDETEDFQGDFMSTPSLGEDDYADLVEAVEQMSRGGLIMIEA